MSKRYALNGDKSRVILLTLKHKLRFDYMRSDKVTHAVEKVEEGCALYLSLGWVTRDRDDGRKEA